VVSTPQRVRITDEALARFAELDSAPAARWRSQEFNDKAHELARLLGLTDEFWTGCSVLDRSSGPVHTSLDYIEHRDWHTCRRVRLELLAALGEQDKGSSSR
jgi:hypothetical protein